MTTPQGQQPVRASAMKRYGPVIAVVGVIAVIAVAVTLAGRKDPSSDSTKTAEGSGVTPVAAGGNPDIPITYEQAKKQGKEGSITWVDNCDPATGRIKMPSVYAPPCVPKFTGDNGGATSDGVTAGEITILTYLPTKNGDLQALLAGNLDSDELAKETREKYVDMFANLFQTYGRKIKLVEFQSNSAPDDATGGHADAVTVIEKYHPFASIGGPALNPAYADELARQHVVCIGCGLSNPDQFYQDHAPYLWGPQPTPEEFLVNLGDYMTNRIVGHKAEFGGDEVKNSDRKFGVVHFEQNPPVFSELGAKVAECGAARGWESALTETYTFDLGKMGERATTIIAKMKAEGVTSIIFLGDPIMPIYLTKQATAQNYFPEWIVTGTVLTDTTVLGRKYDPEQWKHAFGISNLGARIPRKQAEPWRMHQWYYGTDPAAVNTNALIYVAYQQIMLGIHMAGPKLTPTTFRDGMFNYPLSGGGPTAPQVSFGDHGYFKLPGEGSSCTSDQPRLDYLGTDDMTEIWWDPNAEGPDEQDKTDAKGMWRYANMGKRYLPGQVSKGDSDAFKMDNSITVYDAPPKEDQPPDYPSPAKKS
jgi:hypothetical protein